MKSVFLQLRILIVVGLLQFFFHAGSAFAEETSCHLQTMKQIAGYLSEAILKRYPDAQFSSDDEKFFFQCDFRDATFFENIHGKHVETTSRFSTSQPGVRGAFVIEEFPSPPSKEGGALSSLSIAKDVHDDGYFKEMKWSVSVPQVGKLLSAYIVYIRGTPASLLDELVSLSRVFGSCKSLESFIPINEEKATQLAKAFAMRDAVAKEIIQHDIKVLDKNIPGQWSARHEIVFRGGCCCACDGECDDVIVRMTSEGELVDVKVKHWVCGGRNKRNVDNR